MNECCFNLFANLRQKHIPICEHPDRVVCPRCNTIFNESQIYDILVNSIFIEEGHKEPTHLLPVENLPVDRFPCIDNLQPYIAETIINLDKILENPVLFEKQDYYNMCAGLNTLRWLRRVKN